MIRDVQEELRQLRNLTEAATHAVIQLANSLHKSDLQAIETLFCQREVYQKHRERRFNAEVADAEIVLEKNYRSAGAQPHGLAWVPRKDFEKVESAYYKLRTELEKLQSEQPDS